MEDQKANLESMLLGYYIKYDTLDNLVSQAYQNYQRPDINIYIDIYDMLKQIYAREVYTNKKFLIVSSIINMVAHYRSYFRKRYRAYATIYLVYGDESNTNHRMFYNSFGDDIRELAQYTSNEKYISDQLELVKILVGYIKDVYLIKSTSNFAMFVYNQCQLDKTKAQLVITKSKYAYQLASMCNNVTIFRPTKISGEDRSYAINSGNVLMMSYNKITGEKNLRILMEFNPQLLSLLLSMTGLKSYHMTAALNTTQTFKLVDDAIKNNRILNGYNSDIDYVYNNLYGIQNFIDQTNFSYRFKAVDLIYQYNMYIQTPEAMDQTWHINLSDPETIKEINDKYFYDNPLDLESL